MRPDSAYLPPSGACFRHQGAWAFACAMLLAASVAHASGTALVVPNSSAFKAWQSGAIHPLSNLDHFVTFAMLGVWSAAYVRQAWMVALVFLLMLMGGAWLGFSNAKPLPVEPLIAASVVVLGLLLAFRVSAPMVLAAWLATAIAFAHGAAHGSELRGPVEFWALLGLVCSAVLLLALGSLTGLALRRAPPIVSRGLGVAVAAIGCFLFARVV